MSISSAFQIAGSGLRSTEERASLVAGNIANAQTQGYARRESVQTSGGTAGQGSVVETRIVRQIDERLAAMTRRAGADVGGASVAGEILGGYLLTLGKPEEEVSPAARMADFQSGLDLLANNPSDTNVQRDLLARADGLVRTLNNASVNLDRSFAQAGTEFERSVGSANDHLNNIADLNQQLRRESSFSHQFGDLMDQMTRELDALGPLIAFQTRWEPDGTLTLHSAGGTELVIGDDAVRLTLDKETGALSARDVDITPNSTGGRGFSEGRLAGLSEMITTVIPQMKLQLDEMARGLIDSFQSADASLASGQAGLFTDGGNAFDASTLDGLAGRLAINDAVRSDKGGALWRLRDGMGASDPGDVGSTVQIDAFISALDSPQSFSPETGLGGNQRLDEFAALMVGYQHNVRVSADARSETAGIKMASFENARGSVEGVNVDTELQKLLEIEQAYGANAQVLTSLTTMIDTLLDAV